ncbi:hypothetical protein SAMN04487948_14610 [Halogranum amylolyticum]|uniref:Uncharacterized protein n=1 Tax=Halogranum amylolyticum TaxID=660520 RepID=A0A1H8WIE6_9EURY|nr:hypothetical protein [Halogranum amylolyticum]SEP27379.1 hypothetical protein SAMN04487948_13039 [Halogranum amylolyticum]SEP31613.1 hypothetical protein SAMN04487948_14610 [Halogranum amylolyticum]
MEPATFRQVSGFIAICTGGYSILGSMGGFSRILGEEIMFGLGVVALLYGMLLLTRHGERLTKWNATMFIILASLMAVNQLAYNPTPAFADGEMWNDNLGSQNGMYILISILGLLGIVSWWFESEFTERTN